MNPSQHVFDVTAVSHSLIQSSWKFQEILSTLLATTYKNISRFGDVVPSSTSDLLRNSLLMITDLRFELHILDYSCSDILGTTDYIYVTNIRSRFVIGWNRQTFSISQVLSNPYFQWRDSDSHKSPIFHLSIDNIIWFFLIVIFLNLQGQRFVGRRRPFGTPLPTRRCRESSPSTSIRIPSKNTSTIVSLVTARIVSRMNDRFSIFLIQNIQVMLGCGFAWLFLVEILHLGCHCSNYSQI